MAQNTRWLFKGRKGDTHTTISNTVQEISIIPGYAHFDGTPIFANPYGFIISNTSGNDTNVTIRDAFDGKIRDVIAVKAGTTVPWTVHPDGTREQTTANNDWTAQSSASNAILEITALYLKNC